MVHATQNGSKLSAPEGIKLSTAETAQKVETPSNSEPLSLKGSKPPKERVYRDKTAFPDDQYWNVKTYGEHMLNKSKSQAYAPVHQYEKIAQRHNKSLKQRRSNQNPQ
jgi:hypothetical protein